MLRRVILWAVVLFVLGPVSAWPDVAALSFNDSQNTLQTVQPGKRYINPASPLRLYLTAGLDRKVGYVITDDTNQTVAAGVSGLITPSDTMTVLGQTYYGKVLTTPTTLAEGSYTLTAQILDSAGKVVSAQSYPLGVDLTPPTAGGIWWHSHYYNDYITGSEIVSPYYMFNLFAKEISDPAGIDRVQFESFNPSDGSVYYSVPAWYDASARTAGIGTGQPYSVTRGVHLPEMDGLLGLRFIVYDKAGNKTVAQATTKYNGSHNPLPELVAVYNPNVTSEFIPGSGLVGFEAYTPGMTVHSNPIKLLYRLLKTNWVGANPDYGLSPVGGTSVYSDAQYVYFKFEGVYSTYGRMEPYYNNGFASPQWYLSNVQLIYYNLILSPSAPLPPKVMSCQWKLSDEGWRNNGSIIRNQPVTIQQVKVTVEPRNYNQIVQVYSTLPTQYVTIPAGETEALIDINYTTHPGMRLEQGLVTVWSEDKTLRNLYDYLNIFTDTLSPSITSYTIDRAAKTVTFQVTEPQSDYFATSGYPGLVHGWLVAHNSATGTDALITSPVTRLSGDNYQIEINYASLPERDWEFTLWARDRFGNTTSQSAETVVLDQTPPAVQFYQSAMAMANHDPADSLGKVSFKVTDNVDPSPRVESVRLTGGPQNTDVYLAYHQQNKDYFLEYPVLYPSAGQEYNLAVTVKDASGNRATRTLAFAYNPPTVQLSSSGQGALNLPALPAAVVHADGGNALVSEPIAIGERAVSGAYDLVVVSASGSTATAVINNVTVSPGELKTIPGYDFGVHGGRLDLPLWSDQPGQVHLLITSLAPNFPVLTAQVNFWQPQVALTADPGWGVQPLIQPQKIGATGSPCQTTLNAAEAQAADPIDSPKCLVEFTRKPAAYREQGGLLQGVLGPSDPLELEYQVSLYNGGQKYVFGSGSQALERMPITDVSVKATATPGPQVYRKVQSLQIATASDGAIPCKLTASESQARQIGLSGLVCLLRWTQVPNGLQPLAENGASLSGSLQDEGEQVLAWSVDLYSPAGNMPDALSRSLVLRSDNPPLPAFEIKPGLYGEKIDESNYATSELTQGEFARVGFRLPKKSINFTLEMEDGQGGLKSYQYMSSGDNISYSRPLYAGALSVWQTRPVTVRGYYTALPDVKVEQRLLVLGVPSQRMKAVLAGPRETTDTSGVPLKLQVGLPVSGAQISYQAERDGAWEARFGKLEKDQSFTPLTGYQPLSGAVLETTLNGLPVGYSTLAAQARLKPPLLGTRGGSYTGAPAYHREIKSNNLYATVLKGTAPEGRLICRTPSGPAPLTTVVALQVDMDSLRVLGEVAWELSRDAGASWQPLPVKTPMQANLSLTTGQYLMRAKLSNKITQVSGYTDSLGVIAYRVPQVVVNGPRAVFVGTPVNLTAQVQLDGQAMPDDQVVVQWYNARNQKVQDGPTLPLTSQTPLTLAYRVRARLKEAPETDTAAWRSANAAVQVMPPRPPGGVIVAPNYIEYNTVAAQTYTLTAKLVLPVGLDTEQYPVHGEWRLPDGQTVAGLELQYSPTAQDGAKRQALFEFAAWIEGYQDQTTAVFRRLLPVGTYSWPEFRVHAVTSPAMAPSTVILTAEPVGLAPYQLQKPGCEWQLPDGVTKVRDLDSGSRSIMVNFPDPGDHLVSVRITDARGSTAQATGTVSLAEPPPFEVTFNPLYSNIQHRELLDLSLRPSVRGGHPQDRLVQWAFSVSDPAARVAGVDQNTIIKGLHAGQWNIHLRADSKLGKVTEMDYPVTVIANQPPTCTITSYDTSDARWFNAACRDPDGRLVATRWFLDGRQISLGQIIRVVRGAAGALRFEAEDDAGAKYTEALSTP